MRKLKEEAAELMGGRVGFDVFRGQDQALVKEICGSWNGRKKIGKNGTVTVAQAIVLAQGVKALQGDKVAAEFLQKLSDGHSQDAEKEEMAEGNITVRVQWTE